VCNVVQKLMTDREFDKLLEDDSQSDADLGRRRKKRKRHDVVVSLFCLIFMLFCINLLKYLWFIQAFFLDL